MLYPETNNHWNNYSSTLALLLAGGRRDPVIIALMATESFFRPALNRSLEYLYWFVLNMIAPGKSKYVSVGISQTQVRHWESAGIISCSTSAILALNKFFNPSLNYDVCKKYLENTDVQYDRPYGIVRAYSGNATKYHISVFENFLHRSLAACALTRKSGIRGLGASWQGRIIQRVGSPPR